MREFISEMVTRNYSLCPIKDTLAQCIETALYDFSDGCIYIVNSTQGIKYESLDDDMKLRESDKVMLVKLKYVRGIIW